MADARDDPPPDAPWYAPGHVKTTLPSKGQPGELLFEFHVFIDVTLSPETSVS